MKRENNLNYLVFLKECRELIISIILLSRKGRIGYLDKDNKFNYNSSFLYNFKTREETYKVVRQFNDISENYLIALKTFSGIQVELRFNIEKINNVMRIIDMQMEIGRQNFKKYFNLFFDNYNIEIDSEIKLLIFRLNKVFLKELNFEYNDEGRDLNVALKTFSNLTLN